MKTFQRFLESKIVVEAAPAPPPAGGSPAPPAGTPPGPDIGALGGGLGGPSMPPPPMGGGLSGLGGPPMGGPPMGGPPMGAAPGATGPTNKLKAYNVWDVLERILGTETNESVVSKSSKNKK